jgi:hypothetical protein
MSENFKPSLERPDRTLGDEWADWNGKDDKSVESRKGLFIFFALAVILFINIFLGFAYYLTLPRLEQFYSWLPALIFISMTLWMIVTTGLWVQLFLTVYTGKNYFFFKKHIFFIFDLVFQRVFKLTKLLRITRDKMGHSFVLVSNAVVMAVEKESDKKRVMVLLPRCLTKETIQQIYKFKEAYPIEVYTVSGGELARKKVKEYNPSAIIGVACERDLVSGIRDVATKIPVIGIPNRRPDGPCKETLVDVEEIKKAIEFCMK